MLCGRKAKPYSEAAVIDCRLFCGTRGSGCVDTLGLCPSLKTDPTWPFLRPQGIRFY